MVGLRCLNFLFVCVVFALILFSCSKNDKAIAENLTMLQHVVDQNPDSVLSILDSVYPYNLNEEDYNKYLLIQIQAKDKLYKDIANDTVIFKVRDYYVRKSDIDNAALALFYCGRVFHEQGKNKEAIEEYQKADKYADKTKNDNLKGLSQSLIGEILLKEYMHTVEIEYFKIASKYFHQAQNIKNEIISYELIGQAYLMDSKIDSALFYYNMGEQLAFLTKNNLQQANILHDIGNAYMQLEKYKEALKYFRKVVKYGEVFMTEDNKAKLYLNFARVFHHTGQSDSAQFYIDKSLSLERNINDNKVLASIFKTLSSMEEKKGNLRSSLDYQKKYKDERLRNEKNRIEIKSQKNLLFSSIALLVIGSIALYFYRKSVQKNKSVLKKENELLDAQSKIYQLLEMAKSYDEKDNNIRNIVLHHFDI